MINLRRLSVALIFTLSLNTFSYVRGTTEKQATTRESNQQKKHFQKITPTNYKKPVIMITGVVGVILAGTVTLLCIKVHFFRSTSQQQSKW